MVYPLAVASGRHVPSFAAPKERHRPRNAKGVDEDHIAFSQHVQMGRQRPHAIYLASQVASQVGMGMAGNPSQTRVYR